MIDNTLEPGERRDDKIAPFASWNLITMRRSLILIPFLGAVCNGASAGVTAITNKQQWQAASGQYLPAFTVVTDQYAPLGIQFTDGNDFIRVSGSYSDNHGLASVDAPGDVGRVHMSFCEPIYAIGFEFLDVLVIDLLSDEELLFTSNWYVSGFTPFVGLISTVPFDAVIARDINQNVMTIDNILFGPPVPAPGGLLTLGVGAIILAGRRRR